MRRDRTCAVQRLREADLDASNAVLLAVCCVATVVLGTLGGIGGAGSGPGATAPAARPSPAAVREAAEPPRAVGCRAHAGHAACTLRNIPVA